MIITSILLYRLHHQLRRWGPCGAVKNLDNLRQLPKSQTHPPLMLFTAPHLDEYHRYKLIIVGEHNTGKTSLMNRFTTGNFFDSCYTNTVSVDFINRVVQLDGTKIKLQVWVIRRTPRLSLPRIYYKGACCAVITYSATDEESFKSVPYWIEEMKTNAHPDIRLALMGTKCDCTKDKVVEYHRARDFANERQIPFFEVSSKDGTNVELAFMTLVTGLRQLEITSASSQYKK